MPLIKIDYSQTLLDKSQIEELIQQLLQETMRIYDYGEDKVSIFTAAYGEYHFSTAAAEIEVRAKKAEYDKPDISPEELRQKHIGEYKTFLSNFITKQKIAKGVVFTITFEDWQVIWLPGNEDGEN